MKIRKFFRGSGRVLAFVFVASVIWLLFDMAALRLSINDVNSQLLKELVVKERAAMKRQATSRTHAPKRLFKHPVEKVPVDLGDIVENAKRLDTNVANVYRRKQKPVFRERTVAGNAAKPKPDSVERSDKKVIENNVLGSLQSVKPLRKEPSLNSTKTVKAAALDKAKLLKAVTEGIKDAVAKDIGQKAKVQDVKDAAFTKAPPAVQEEERRVVPKRAEDKAVKIGTNIPEEKSKENLKDISNKKASEAAKAGFQQHPKNDTKLEPKPDVQQVAGVLRPADQNSELLNKNDPHPVKTQIQLTLPPKVQKVEPSKAKPTVPVKKPGALHKVMALDVTEKPRDAQAMGQFGHAAVVPKGKEAESQSRWNEGHFNVYLSEQIPIDRSIPDTRPALCSEKMVHDDLPTTSVIFCFVDEVWSTLLRSVHSVLNRSPPHLLKEIILVDDCSTKDNLKEPLDKYMAQFPKVRIIRLKERQGLIRARIAGAAQATGEVLTFLDSHIECNIGWLEPLLERVYVDRRKVACPVIEVISDKDMSYVQVDNFQRGIFKWPLVFGWNTLSEDIIKKNQMKDSDPLRCPVMAGGLFSIDKKYFYELGTYDPGLDVWGGENMEISFKIWMCGGEIEIIPCSRVGHIFRGQNPYKFPKDRQKTVERNLARVAEVWLDEYKELFYGHGYHHLLDKTVIDVGNLTEQIQLRQRLKCKSFKWYLENIYPDMEAPVVKAEGIVFNPGTRKCLALQNTTLVFATCDLSNQNQHFSYTWLRLIKQQGLCVVPHGLANRVSVEPCDPINANQRWMLNTNKVMAEHIIVESSARRLCLEAGPKGDGIYVKDCFSGNEHQRWQFTNVYAQ